MHVAPLAEFSGASSVLREVPLYQVLREFSSVLSLQACPGLPFIHFFFLIGCRFPGLSRGLGLSDLGQGPQRVKDLVSSGLRV